MEEGLIILAIYVGIAFAIAHFLGRKRQIGFGWSFFFCLTLNPVFGFIITMLSRKYYDENPTPSSGKRIVGWILVVLFSLGLFTTLLKLSNDPYPDESDFGLLPFGAGLVGLGLYLIGLGKGKNYNKGALTRTDE